MAAPTRPTASQPASTPNMRGTRSSSAPCCGGPAREELPGYVPELTIIDLPSFKADPARHGVRSDTIIAVNFTRRIVLIGSSSYAGEMKKSVFTFLNYLLPAKGVMPMHCSANAGKDGDVALFFGLSGTGKTTLSADPARTLLGDDEHGWSDTGVFNFEGGCYAKTIRLSKEAEPEIFAASDRFGTILENVILHEDTRVPDFDDGSLTENTRSAYPLDFIPNASPTGRAGVPKNIIMLTADAFGVMPPIARLTPAQAMYHFLSGYTAKVAGTEKGVEGSRGHFLHLLRRALHAAPSVRLWQSAARSHREISGGLLAGEHRLDRRQIWRRPAHAHQVTRTLLTAALDGSLKDAAFRTDPYFGFSVPHRFRASSRTSSIRPRPGRTRRTSTPLPASSSPCSGTISRSSRGMWMRRCAMPSRRCGSPPSDRLTQR